MADIRSPRIRFPRDGAAVDGLAATFSWEPVEGAAYRIQVSASDRFDDVMLDVDAGESTSLTLFELLPRDGRRLAWRVANLEKDAEPLWSNPAWFLSADAEDRPAAAPAAPAARPVPASTAPDRSEAPTGADVPLYLQDTTSSREVVIATVVLVATVVLLLVIAF